MHQKHQGGDGSLFLWLISVVLCKRGSVYLMHVMPLQDYMLLAGCKRGSHLVMPLQYLVLMVMMVFGFPMVPRCTRGSLQGMPLQPSLLVFMMWCAGTRGSFLGMPLPAVELVIKLFAGKRGSCPRMPLPRGAV